MNKNSRLATIAALVATVHMAAAPIIAQAAAPQGVAGLTESQVQQVIANLNAKLNELGVQGRVTGATREGTNTIFQLQPNAGVSVETLQQQLVAAQNSISAATVSATPINAIVVSDAVLTGWAAGFGVAGVAAASLLPAVLALGLLGVGIAGIGGDASPPAPPPPPPPPTTTTTEATTTTTTTTTGT